MRSALLLKRDSAALRARKWRTLREYVARAFNSVQHFLDRLRSVCSLSFVLAICGVFTPVLAKHTKSFNLIDTLAVGVDRIQRNFEPLQRQVELWRKTQVTDERAKL